MICRQTSGEYYFRLYTDGIYCGSAAILGRGRDGGNLSHRAQGGLRTAGGGYYFINNDVL